MTHIVVRFTAIIIALLFLAAAFLGAPGTSFAGTEGALCEASPTSVPTGESLTITCTGFSPNTWVFAYQVEPDGTAIAFGSIKTNEEGTAAATIETNFGWAREKTGVWRLVVEETGLAKSVLVRGIAEYTVMGGTEGVSGAYLSADPDMVYKPEVGYSFQREDVTAPGVDVHVRFTDTNKATTTVSGSGFAPGEIVSFWIDPPNGGCSNSTTRLDSRYVIQAPGLDVNARLVQTGANFEAGVQALGDAKAGADGSVQFTILFDLTDCEGVYHVVGRGNTSGWGAETNVTLVGNAVVENAWLSASPGAVGGLFDRVTFSGSGFAAGEHVSCWLTSPQGQVWAIPGINYVNGTVIVPGVSQIIRDTQIFADNGGGFTFDIVTGSEYISIQGKYDIGIPGLSNRVFEYPYQSEGAIGEYAASCRGDTSGRVGVARFLVTGNELTP